VTEAVRSAAVSRGRGLDTEPSPKCWRTGLQWTVVRRSSECLDLQGSVSSPPSLCWRSPARTYSQTWFLALYVTVVRIPSVLGVRTTNVFVVVAIMWRRFRRSCCRNRR